MSDATVEQRERPVFAHGPVAVLNLYQHRPTDLIENIRAAFSEVFDVADDVAAAIKRELKILETGGKG